MLSQNRMFTINIMKGQGSSLHTCSTFFSLKKSLTYLCIPFKYTVILICMCLFEIYCTYTIYLNKILFKLSTIYVSANLTQISTVTPPTVPPLTSKSFFLLYCYYVTNICCYTYYHFTMFNICLLFSQLVYL